MRDFEGAPPPSSTVILVSPGGVACVPFAEGYAAVRVCLGLLFDAEDGLEAEVRLGRRPVPWRSGAARGEALAELRAMARGARGDERAGLVRLIGHVLDTPYYEAG